MARKIQDLIDATSVAGTDSIIVHQTTEDKEATLSQVKDYIEPIIDHGSISGLTDADHPASGISFTTNDRILGRITSGAGAGEELQFSDIDHDQLENTHNLTTDIDHDQLTNFASDEHRKITLSTSDPSGGVDGDIWFKYIP